MIDVEEFNKNMWSDHLDLTEYKADLLERESGDGDSGAEYKDPTIPSPLMVRKASGQDFREVKNALANIAREVQGAEKAKDIKKPSRIPIRQTSKNKLISKSDLMEANKYFDLDRTSNMINRCIKSEETLTEIISTENFLSDWRETSNPEKEASNIERDRTFMSNIVSELQEYKNKEVVQKQLSEIELSENIEDEPDMKIVEEYKDIYDDLSKVPGVDDQETSLETSLSPRAPLAEEELILEAPEEFRGEHSEINIDTINASQYDYNERSVEPCHQEEIVTADRVHGPAPEVRCGPSEIEQDSANITPRGNEIELADINTGRTNVIGANGEDIITIERLQETQGGGTRDNYHKQTSDDPVADGARVVKDGVGEALALNILRGRAAMRTLADCTGLKIVENLEHLTQKPQTDFNSDSNFQEEPIIKENSLLSFSSISEGISNKQKLEIDKKHNVTNSERFNKTVKDESLEYLTLRKLANQQNVFTDSEINTTTSFAIGETSKILESITEYIDDDCEDVSKDRSLQIISDSAVMKEMSILTQPLNKTSQITDNNEVVKSDTMTASNFKLLSPNKINDGSKINDKDLKIIADLPCLLKPLVPLKFVSNQEEGRDVVDFSKSLLSKPNLSWESKQKPSNVEQVDEQASENSVSNSISGVFTKYTRSSVFSNNGKEDVTVQEFVSTKHFNETIEEQKDGLKETHNLGGDNLNTTKRDEIQCSAVSVSNSSACDSLLADGTGQVSVGTSPGRPVVAACERSALAAAAAVVVASIQSADAQATRCSRVPTVKVRASLEHDSPADAFGHDDGQHASSSLIAPVPPVYHGDISARDSILCEKTSGAGEQNTSAGVNDSAEISTTERSTILDTVVKCTERIETEIKDQRDTELLRSRDINKRSSEGSSRLKLLGEKLKEAAGLSDHKQSEISKHKDIKKDVSDSETKQAPKPKNIDKVLLDKNENECKQITVERDNSEEDEEDFYPQVEITELGSPADLDAFLDDRFGGRCEFDVRRIGTFTGYGGNEFFVVYDELEDDCESEDEACNKIKLQTLSMRGEGAQEAPKRHNPDHDNLKSLLKKPGGKGNKKNRVSFNETKNEFFDADYIILIREDCDYDEDDDDGVCTCNQHEMVRLTCCEPDCNCNAYEDQTPQSPKFAPPLEFVDAVTLSPPEGYKDMDQQLLALQQMARQRGAVCRECSGHHDSGNTIYYILLSKQSVLPMSEL